MFICCCCFDLEGAQWQRVAVFAGARVGGSYGLTAPTDPLRAQAAQIAHTPTFNHIRQNLNPFDQHAVQFEQQIGFLFVRERGSSEGELDFVVDDGRVLFVVGDENLHDRVGGDAVVLSQRDQSG